MIVVLPAESDLFFIALLYYCHCELPLVFTVCFSTGSVGHKFRQNFKRDRNRVPTYPCSYGSHSVLPCIVH